MKYNHLDMLPEKAFRPVGKRMTLEGGGGGGQQTSTGTTYTSNVPEYAKPYYEELLKQTGKETFKTNSKGVVTGIKDYTPYTGERVAGFTPGQTNIQNQFARLTTPGGFAKASAGTNYGQNLGYGAASAGINQALSYRPNNFSTQRVQAPSLQDFQMRGPQGVSAPSLQNYNMGAAQSGYNPDLQTYLMGNAQDVNAPSIQNYGMSAARGSFDPNLQTFQMANARDINAPSLQNYSMSAAQANFDPNLQSYQMQNVLNAGPERVGTQIFGQGAADYYSNPYTQNVTNTALREAMQKGAIDKSAGAMGAIGRGTFGGARNALIQAEQTRGLNQQLGDIQYKGSADAYANAQQQFQADQARQLQAGTSNQQAGLQTILANQQAGLTTGQQNLSAMLQTQGLGAGIGKDMALANLTNAQQSNVQNLASQLQTQGLSADQAMKAALANQQAGLTTGQQNLASQQATQQLGAGIGKDLTLANLTNEQQSNVQNLAAQLQTQGLSADAAMKAALANQQAGLTIGQQNLASQQATQQLGAGIGKDVSLANLTSAQQANVQNLAAQLQTQGLSADAAMKAALANQQAGLTTGQQNLQANLQTQQLGAGQDMAAQQANQAAWLQAQQMAEQSKQFGAGMSKDVGLAGLQAGLDASKTQGALAAAQQTADLERLRAQSSSAAEQQAYKQKIDDLKYQQSMEAQDWQKKQLEFYSNILHGTSGALGSTQVNYTPQASPISQLAGAGVAGLSAYNLMNKG